jgi:hypothetical protein
MRSWIDKGTELGLRVTGKQLRMAAAHQAGAGHRDPQRAH